MALQQALCLATWGWLLEAHLPGAGYAGSSPTRRSSPAPGGWLLRLLPRYALGRPGPNGRLRCGPEARPKSPIPPPTSPPRCTLARAASHSTCGRRIWRCMRRRASHCGPWPRAMSRSSWPRAAAWSKENRLGSSRAGHPQPEALKARGALALALVLAYGGPLGFSADLRPRGPPAVQPLHLVRAVAQGTGCTDPSGARPRCV